MKLKNLIAVASRGNGLSFADKFAFDLKQTIEEKAEQNNFAPSKWLKPSSMNCNRQMYYVRREMPITAPAKTSANLVGICENGTDRHAKIQEYLTLMQNKGYEYLDVETYVKEHNLKDIKIYGKYGLETACFNTKLNMSFRTDGLLRKDGKTVIFEFKTENDFGFFKRADYAEKHKNQGIAYSLCFGIPDVLFLYENRATLDKKAYMMKVTKEMADELLYNISIVENAVRKGVLPAGCNDTKVCQYCPYVDHCRRNEA